jgi:hypothetical protein
MRNLPPSLTLAFLIATSSAMLRAQTAISVARDDSTSTASRHLVSLGMGLASTAFRDRVVSPLTYHGYGIPINVRYAYQGARDEHSIEGSIESRRFNSYTMTSRETRRYAGFFGSFEQGVAEQTVDDVRYTYRRTIDSARSLSVTASLAYSLAVREYWLVARSVDVPSEGQAWSREGYVGLCVGAGARYPIGDVTLTGDVSAFVAGLALRPRYGGDVGTVFDDDSALWPLQRAHAASAVDLQAFALALGARVPLFMERLHIVPRFFLGYQRFGDESATVRSLLSVDVEVTL